MHMCCGVTFKVECCGSICVYCMVFEEDRWMGMCLSGVCGVWIVEWVCVCPLVWIWMMNVCVCVVCVFFFRFCLCVCLPAFGRVGCWRFVLNTSCSVSYSCLRLLIRCVLLHPVY